MLLVLALLSVERVCNFVKRISSAAEVNFDRRVKSNLHRGSAMLPQAASLLRKS